MAEFVIFDLEANSDRADPAEHEIIEIGAVAVRGLEKVDEYQTLVHASRPVRSEVLELTAIDPASLEGAPDLAAALQGFLDWVGDRALVAHNGFGYDFIVLDAACDGAGVARNAGTRLDSLDLAHVIFPRAGRGMTHSVGGTQPPDGRGLSDLATHLGLAVSDRHRALADADLTHQVVVRLLIALRGNDPVRVLQRWILRQGFHPWAEYVNAPVEPPPLESLLSPATQLPVRVPTGEYDPGWVVDAFKAGGLLMRDGRSPRSQQAQMAGAVSDSLARGGTIIVEAPTGTGKTLGYLVPAIEYARASGRPVIVAAHSKVLQNQILGTIEELTTVLEPFTFTLLKGRENYISLEACAGELEGDPPDAETALALAVIVGWLSESPTGDWDDLRAWYLEQRSPALARLKWRLRVDASPGPPMTQLDRLCFYRRALDRAVKCDIAVFNHALLVRRTDWIGRVETLVLDEAHNLEESATAALSEGLTMELIKMLCASIWDPTRRSGTLRRLADATDWSVHHEHLENLRDAVEKTRTAADLLSERIIEYVRDRTGAQREEVERYGTSYRVRRGLDTTRPGYQPVLHAAGVLRGCLHEIGDAFNRITVPQELHGRYRRQRLEAELARLGRSSREWSELIDSVVWAAGDTWIHIIDLEVRDGSWTWGLRRVPISIAGALSDIWAKLRASVFTSATLRVGGTFDHIIRTLGLDAAEPLALGSPFPDLTRNHLVVLTDYLTAPRGRLLEEFTYQEASEIPRLLVLTHGRGMVLFTARSRLEYVRDHARPLVELEGIPLLAQGDESSGALAERMRTDTTASLLALRSFWEGIDIPGEALSLLVIEKVPFDPPTDPVVAARMEAMEIQGHDPFGDYLVPRAVIRFAQGVGRLIRSNDDVGVTVVLDNRLRRAVPYRERMLGALVGPPTFLRGDSRPETYRSIAGHLGITLDSELQAAIDRIPSADPWSQLETLELRPDELRTEATIIDRLEQARELFGFENWRPGQLETMVRFMQGEDVLAVLPTGSGKSITFQIPALLSRGVTLVVSPLIALMRDQAENLRGRGIATVAAIHSGVPQSEQQAILRGAARGHYKLIYVSPERLWSPLFQAALRSVEVARVAVDEAHCISQWGHSFRPEYTLIPTALRSLQPEGDRPPVLAVTATATPRVQKEIISLLDLHLQSRAVVRSPDRPEIRYYTERCADVDDRDLRVINVLESFRGASTIVYVPSRKTAQHIAGLLQAAGHSTRPYHGGMQSEERLHVEDAFRHGEVHVVVGTKAFGLGIDKPDIAAIVHIEMPASIEEYVQETGRVARGAIDGTGPETGTCVLLVTPRDCRIHRFFVKNAAPDVDDIKRVWGALEVGHNYRLPEELTGQHGDPEQQSAALAVHYLIEEGAIRRHHDVVWEGRVWVPGDAYALIDELATHDTPMAAKAREVVALVDRLGSYDYHVMRWSELLKQSPEQVESTILELHSRDVIGFVAWEYAWHLERLPVVDPDWSRIDDAAIDRRHRIQELADHAKSFAREPSACRRAAILGYLGMEPDPSCGACDACNPSLPRPWRDSAVTRDAIIDSLPARRICVSLVGDVAPAGFSRNSIIRALLGEDGQRYPLSTRLKDHPSFGRLAILGRARLEQLIQTLIDDGRIEEQERLMSNGTAYMSLVPTELGRREFL